MLCFYDGVNLTFLPSLLMQSLNRASLAVSGLSCQVVWSACLQVSESQGEKKLGLFFLSFSSVETHSGQMYSVVTAPSWHVSPTVLTTWTLADSGRASSVSSIDWEFTVDLLTWSCTPRFLTDKLSLLCAGASSLLCHCLLQQTRDSLLYPP